MKEAIKRPKDIQKFSDPYPVMEHFHTIQGEGIHTGSAAYFIRLAGCDVGCPWCDVKESWWQDYPQLTSNALAETAQKAGSEIAVITGGEPLMHNCDALCRELKNRGLKRHIETSGAYELSGEWDWICLSPKKFKEARAEVAKLADELKVIIFNSSDFDFALKEAQKVSPDCQLLIQPEWSREKRVLPEMIDFVRSNPKWRISLQTHKYMDIP